MAVHFDDRRIVLFGDSLLYEKYYFLEAAQYASLDYLAVVKRVLEQWGEALASITDNQATLFLPFGPGDESTECLAATVKHKQVTLRNIWVDVEGYSIDLLDLHGFIVSPHKILQQCSENFGTYERDKLITALTQAKLSLS